jgi:hypothetical protein
MGTCVSQTRAWSESKASVIESTENAFPESSYQMRSDARESGIRARTRAKKIAMNGKTKKRKRIHSDIGTSRSVACYDES